MFGCHGNVGEGVVIVGGSQGAFLLHYLVGPVWGCCSPAGGLLSVVRVRFSVSVCLVLCPLVGGVEVRRVKSDSAAERGCLRPAVCLLSRYGCCASGYGGYVQQCGI